MIENCSKCKGMHSSIILSTLCEQLVKSHALTGRRQCHGYNTVNIHFWTTDKESFGTVVCYLSVFLQCSGQVHSCSQLQNVPPLSPPFSTLAHQRALHHSFSTASVSALQTYSPWDYDHQFALEFQD